MNEREKKLVELLSGYVTHCNILERAHDNKQTPHDCADAIRIAESALLQFHKRNKSIALEVMQHDIQTC